MIIENFLNNRNGIIIANELNQVEFNLGSMSFDILCIMLAQIEKEDTEFKYYELFVSTIEKRINRKLNRSSLKKASNELKNATVSVENRVIKWFEIFEYDSPSGVIKIKFNDQLKPYLLNLENEFTLGNLKSILKLNGYYSKRFYFLLAQYLTMKKFTYDLEKLQNLLSVSDSMKKSYSNFKLRVLDPAIKDINKYSNITIDFKENKISRSVVSIKFRIKPKPKQQTSPEHNSGVNALEKWLSRS